MYKFTLLRSSTSNSIAVIEPLGTSNTAGVIEGFESMALRCKFSDKLKGETKLK